MSHLATLHRSFSLCRFETISKSFSYCGLWNKLFYLSSLTLPETNIAPEIGHPKRKLVFQPSTFRCYVSFREVNCLSLFQKKNTCQTVRHVWSALLSGVRWVFETKAPQWLSDIFKKCFKTLETSDFKHLFRKKTCGWVFCWTKKWHSKIPKNITKHLPLRYSWYSANP